MKTLFILLFSIAVCSQSFGQNGCTVQYAINYDELATEEDGSCTFPAVGDYNNDGSYSAADLSGILSEFGRPMDVPGYFHLGDFNTSGDVTAYDVTQFLSLFGGSVEE